MKKKRKDKKKIIGGILNKQDGINMKFEYFEYDWTSNASLDTLAFQKNGLSVTKRACFIL